MAILNLERDYAAWLQREWLPNPQVHQFLWRVAGFCRANGASQEETFALLRQCADRHPDRRVPDDEIWRQIRSAWTDRGADQPRRPPWPPPDPNKRARALSRGVTVQSWSAVSQPPPTVHEVIQACFRDTEYVCLGVSASRPVCRMREDWLRDPALGDYSYLTPNPMRGAIGLTKASWEASPEDPWAEDHWGPRTDLNVAGRRFLNVEFDQDSLDDQAAFIAAIVQAGGIPPRAITWSGSKSLHALFYVGHLSPESARHWFGLATAYGADPQLWTPSQFCRLPGGFNQETQQRQTILYWKAP